MPKKPDDVTSKKNATLAAGVLKGTINPTKAQVKTLAAIVLDNAANKPNPKPAAVKKPAKQ